MNKLRFNFLTFTLLMSSFGFTNQMFAHQSNNDEEEEVWEVEIDEEHQPIKIANNQSFSDYITLKNVAAFTVVTAVGFATGGAGLSATAQYFGVAGAPAMGSATVAGAFVGTAVGITTGGTALAIKKCRE